MVWTLESLHVYNFQPKITFFISGLFIKQIIILHAWKHKQLKIIWMCVQYVGMHIVSTMWSIQPNQMKWEVVNALSLALALAFTHFPHIPFYCRSPVDKTFAIFVLGMGLWGCLVPYDELMIIENVTKSWETTIKLEAMQSKINRATRKK